MLSEFLDKDLSLSQISLNNSEPLDVGTNIVDVISGFPFLPSTILLLETVGLLDSELALLHPSPDLSLDKVDLFNSEAILLHDASDPK